MKSSFEKLFNSQPNYSKLKVFGCLCYPWLRPYGSHKLDSRSQPCIFLGYSSTQSAYQCYDPISKKIFISRHVNFIETLFPFSHQSTTLSRPTVTTFHEWTNINPPMHISTSLSPPQNKSTHLSTNPSSSHQIIPINNPQRPLSLTPNIHLQQLTPSITPHIAPNPNSTFTSPINSLNNSTESHSLSISPHSLTHSTTKSQQAVNS